MQVVLEFDFKREARVMDTVADNLKVSTAARMHGFHSHHMPMPRLSSCSSSCSPP